MSSRLSGASLVKSPLFWLSIVAILVVLLCLIYILVSVAQKRQHTSNSTIDIKHMGGNPRDDKNKLDDKKFLKDVLAEVDKKIKKACEDNDKKNDEKMKKLDDKIKNIEDGIKEQIELIVNNAIEDQFKEGEIEGPKLQVIRNIINEATNRALEDAKQYADSAATNGELDPEDVKKILATTLKKLFVETPEGEIQHLSNTDRDLLAMIVMTVTNALQSQTQNVTVSPSDCHGQSYYVTTQQATRIGRLMDNVNNTNYNDTVTLKNVNPRQASYEVTRQNVKSIFPSLALVTLKHPLLYPQGQ